MMTRTPISVQQCQCGYKFCSTYWLNGIGSFSRGSGFEYDEAVFIADTLNEKMGHPKQEHTPQALRPST